jgi:hypothetical protein
MGLGGRKKSESGLPMSPPGTTPQNNGDPTGAGGYPLPAADAMSPPGTTPQNNGDPTGAGGGYPVRVADAMAPEGQVPQSDKTPTGPSGYPVPGPRS